MVGAFLEEGDISLSGVYGGMADPLLMMELFDKQVQLRMGQANVHRWIPDILPLVEGDGDPLGVEDLATHHLPLEDAPRLRDVPEEAGRRDQGDPAPVGRMTPGERGQSPHAGTVPTPVTHPG